MISAAPRSGVSWRRLRKPRWTSSATVWPAPITENIAPCMKAKAIAKVT
jgi:hypothetical protein